MDLNKLHQVTKMLIPQSKRYGLESTSTNVPMKLPRDLEITLLAVVKSKSTLGTDVHDKSQVDCWCRLPFDDDDGSTVDGDGAVCVFVACENVVLCLMGRLKKVKDGGKIEFLCCRY